MSMLRLYSKITFTPKAGGSDIVFDFLNEVEINESYKDLTDTAKITIPRKITFDGKPIATSIDSIFKRGDKVKIELGYFPNLRTVFTGYISRISINSPIEIECDDEMFILKQKNILYPQRYKTITTGKTGKLLKNPKIIPSKIKLIDFVKDVLLEGTDIKYNVLVDVEVNIKRFACSAAKALETLKNDYGLYSYFVLQPNGESVLTIGLASNATKTKTVDFEFEENIIDDSDLSYQRETDIRLKVKAESINSRTNERTTIEIGDDDGAQKDFKIQNATEAELKTFAELKLKEFKYEGYRGTFTTLGESYVQAGDAARLTSKMYPEKNGTYQVVSVNRTFGMSGYRQKIELGIKYK